MRIAIIGATLALAACGQGEQTVSYKDSEGATKTFDVSESGGTTKVESGDGVISAEGTQGGAKANFPAFAPAYPGAKVQSSVDMDVGPVKQHIIVQLTPDKPDAARGFYEEKAKAAGLKTKVIDSPGGAMLAIGEPKIGGLTDTMLTFTETPGGTSISLSQTKQ